MARFTAAAVAVLALAACGTTPPSPPGSPVTDAAATAPTAPGTLQGISSGARIAPSTYSQPAFSYSSSSSFAVPPR